MYNPKPVPLACMSKYKKQSHVVWKGLEVRPHTRPCTISSGLQNGGPANYRFRVLTGLVEDLVEYDIRLLSDGAARAMEGLRSN